MSDLELAVGMSRRLERMLKDGLGADGKGLGQQAISVKDRLPAHTFDNLMRVAGIRNRVVHEGEPIHSPERFQAMCTSIAADLKIVYSLTHAPRVDQSVQTQFTGVNPALLLMTPEEPAPVRAILNAPLDPDAERAKRVRRPVAKTPVVAAKPTFRGLTLPSRAGEASDQEEGENQSATDEAPPEPSENEPKLIVIPRTVPKRRTAPRPVRPPLPDDFGTVAPVPAPPIQRFVPYEPVAPPVAPEVRAAPPQVAPKAPATVKPVPVKPVPQIIVPPAASTELAVVKKRAPAKKVKAPSATFFSIVEEFGVVEDALLGMVIHIELTIQNMKGAPCQATAYFFSGRGEALLDFNDEYCTEDGNVCVWEDFVPRFNDTHLSEFTLFMPYDELHLEIGQHDLRYAIGLHSIDTREQFAASKSRRFSIVY